MKIVLIPSLLALSGLGWLFSRGSYGDTKEKDSPPDLSKLDCKVDARCTPEGTCVITCQSSDGKRCEIELACDGDQCRVIRSEGDCSSTCR